jgi:hypothetical protein
MRSSFSVVLRVGPAASSRRATPELPYISIISHAVVLSNEAHATELIIGPAAALPTGETA